MRLDAKKERIYLDSSLPILDERDQKESMVGDGMAMDLGENSEMGVKYIWISITLRRNTK